MSKKTATKVIDLMEALKASLAKDAESQPTSADSSPDNAQAPTLTHADTRDEEPSLGQLLRASVLVLQQSGYPAFADGVATAAAMLASTADLFTEREVDLCLDMAAVMRGSYGRTPPEGPVIYDKQAAESIEWDTLAAKLAKLANVDRIKLCCYCEDGVSPLGRPCAWCNGCGVWPPQTPIIVDPESDGLNAER